MTLIYAHRGSSARFPENTLAAFRAALESGVDGIEFDVHASADGVPVVIHDRDVSRTTHGHGNIDQLTLDQIRSLDAGNGERVPMLAEVLALVGGRVHLDIEIKGSNIEQQVLEVLRKHPSTRFAISSFDWDILRELRRLDASIELWPLAMIADEALFGIAAEVSSPTVSLAAEAYDATSSLLLQRANLNAMIWTVNDLPEAHRVRELGAFALCTDVPDRMRKAYDAA
jgi:glycerophosphoryl diester phosphodiesterase